MSTLIATRSIAEQVAETFNFSVLKLPLSGPGDLDTPFYGLFRNDTNESVGKPCSGDYVPHTTDDVLAIVEATQEVFEDCEVRMSFRHGHILELAPSRNMRRSIFGTEDNIFPRLNVYAGYDGRAFSTVMGWFRDLCLNMSRITSVSKTSVSIRHTSGLRTKMGELVDQFGGLKDGWNELGDTIVELEATEISLVSFLDTIYPRPSEDAAPRQVTIHRNRTEKIFRRVLMERRTSGRPEISSEGFIVSGWEAYNAVQGYVQHDSTRRGQKTDLDRALMSANDPAVRQAENIVMNLIR